MRPTPATACLAARAPAIYARNSSVISIRHFALFVHATR